MCSVKLVFFVGTDDQDDGVSKHNPWHGKNNSEDDSPQLLQPILKTSLPLLPDDAGVGFWVDTSDCLKGSKQRVFGSSIYTLFP